MKRTYKDGTTEIIEWEGSRVKSVTDRQGRKQSYVYNAKGQLGEIRDGSGVMIDALTYDDAGRLVSWKNADSEIAWSEFNLAGSPKRTVQRRFKDGSDLAASPQLLDEFVQEHRWNEHGERVRFSMPTRPGATLGAGWTKWVGESFDAMGNLVSISRLDADVPTVTTPIMTANYIAAGRPESRTVAVANGSAPIVRHYTYDLVDSRLRKLEVSIGGTVIAGSEVAHDGLQIGEARMLGVSSNERAARWKYDARSRVEASVYGVRNEVQPTVPVPGRVAEQLTKADYREQQARTPLLDAATTSALQSRGIDPSRFDPPGTTFDKQPGGGHKIGRVARGPEVRPFVWQGAERVDDGRFVYVFDVKGRLISATEKTSVPPTRRLLYAYSGTGRVIGRRAEYTTAAAPTASDWKLEDRTQILAADGAPAETTYVWDPLSDRLISLYRAGAAGDPLKQTIHGGAAYDDPLETTTIDPTTGAVTHLYPIYDEAAAGTMHAVVNARGEVVARNLSNDPYGDGDVPLLGAAVDRIAIEAKKNDDGTIASVEVRLHATEQLQAASVAGGARLAMVTTTGTIVTSSPVPPALDATDPFTIRWTLTGAQWTTLTATPDATSLSIAVTDTLRAAAWGADVPVLPAPEWAQATRPIFTSPSLPVELRESRTSLATFVGGISAGEQKTSTLYQLETLALAAAGSESDALFEDVLSARFQALPFVEPVTGLVYARNRWYDPSTGSFLTPDPLGYQDSSNLYAFAGGDPVNRRDPSGLAAAISANGTINGITPAGQKYRYTREYAMAHPREVQRMLDNDSDLSVDDVEELMAKARLPLSVDAISCLPGESCISPVAVEPRHLPHGGRGDFLVGTVLPGGLPATTREMQIGRGQTQVVTAVATTLAVPYVGQLARMQGGGTAVQPVMPFTEEGRTAEIPMDRVIPPLRHLTDRQRFMGGTPGRLSPTGVEVMLRMFREGQLRVGETLEVRTSDGQWISVSETDMSHIVDAVEYWNHEGYATGPQSDQVREFMLNPANYILEQRGPNRSRGASNGQRYHPPYKLQ